MAASRRSRPADAGGAGALLPVLHAVDAALAAHVPAGARVVVAFSGGRDSAALLDACATLAGARGVALCAVHVHHGLSTHADAWVARCAERCAELGVALAVRRVAAPARHVDGVEAAARSLRYAAIADAAREAGAAAVLLAHHQDDQAETLLLQLARGAGAHGLRGMAQADRARDLLWLRPLLGVPRRAIDAYAAARDLRYVEDPSNADVRFRRNAIRTRVAPAIAAAFPGYPGTIARAASLAAESAQLLDDLAALDAGGFVHDGALDRARLASLPDTRARNLLRWFLRTHGLRSPGAARLAQMLRQLSAAAQDARVRILHDGRELGVHRGRVVVHAPPPAPFEVAWRGDAEIALPHGRLRFVRSDGDGLAIARIERATVLVRPRSGGERLRLAPGGPSRSLKHLLQEAGVPHWMRDRLPLVYCDGALAAVPGVAVDAAWRAGRGFAGVLPVWDAAPMPAAAHRR